MNPFRRRIQTAMQQGGGAVAFNPTDIAGLQLWLDASQIVGLNDGDAVGTWSDASGNGRNATQATASKKPVFKTNVQNGKPVIRLDGVDDFMTTSFAYAAGAKTVFVVAKSASVAGYTRAVSSIPDFGLYIGTDILNNNVSTFLGNSAGVWNDTSVNTPNANWSTFKLVTLHTDNVTLTPYVNGTAQNTKNGATGALTGIQIGTFDNGIYGQLWNGDVAEVICYDSALSAGDLVQVTDYLAAKWGL